MVLFTERQEDRVFEKLMTSVPNFQLPCSGLFICEEASVFIPCLYFELLFKTVRHIKNRSFKERFENYMKERKYKPMKFRNSQHETLFKNEVREPRNQSARILTALYLFSADYSLWTRARHCISQETVAFDKISLTGISLPGCTLYNTAITLCSDKEKLSISELANKSIVSSELFGIICEAMALRRYGIAALITSEKETEKLQTNNRTVNIDISS